MGVRSAIRKERGKPIRWRGSRDRMKKRVSVVFGERKRGVRGGGRRLAESNEHFL